jgi:hypothetical protein
MSDPIEARMNFIIEQHAQFAAGMQLLKERQAETQRQVDENAVRVRELVATVDKLTRRNGPKA